MTAPFASQTDPRFANLRRYRALMVAFSSVPQDHPRFKEAQAGLAEARSLFDEERAGLPATFAAQEAAEPAASNDLGPIAAARLGVAAGAPTLAGLAAGSLFGPVGAAAGGMLGFGMGLVGPEPLAQLKEALTPGGASAEDVRAQIAATQEAHPVAFWSGLGGTALAGPVGGTTLARMGREQAKHKAELLAKKAATDAANATTGLRLVQTAAVAAGESPTLAAMRLAQASTAKARTALLEAQRAALTLGTKEAPSLTALRGAQTRAADALTALRQAEAAAIAAGEAAEAPSLVALRAAQESLARASAAARLNEAGASLALKEAQTGATQALRELRLAQTAKLQKLASKGRVAAAASPAAPGSSVGTTSTPVSAAPKHAAATTLPGGFPSLGEFSRAPRKGDVTRLAGLSQTQLTKALEQVASGVVKVHPRWKAALEAEARARLAAQGVPLP